MKKILICILSLFIFISCCENKTTRINPEMLILVDPDRLQEEIDLSSYFEDSVDIIPLETRDNCLLSTIKKIQITDDRIFISDNLIPGVFVFDLNGRFLKRMGQQGAGPKEFIYMGDFNVANNVLYIQDLYGNKYLMINLLSDEITEFSYDIHHLEMIPLKNELFFVSNYFSSSKGYYNLFKFDPLQGCTGTYLPFDKITSEKNLTWGLDRYSGKHKDDVLLIYPRNDTIYEIQNDLIESRYVIQFTKKTIPESLREVSGREVVNISRASGYITGLRYIQHNANNIWATYIEGIYYRYMLIDKKH